MLFGVDGFQILLTLAVIPIVVKRSSGHGSENLTVEGVLLVLEFSAR